MKLALCSCVQCKHGRKSSWGKYFVQHRRKAERSKVRRLIQAGEYENLPQRVAVGYTG